VVITLLDFFSIVPRFIIDRQTRSSHLRPHVFTHYSDTHSLTARLYDHHISVTFDWSSTTFHCSTGPRPRHQFNLNLVLQNKTNNSVRLSSTFRFIPFLCSLARRRRWPSSAESPIQKSIAEPSWHVDVHPHLATITHHPSSNIQPIYLPSPPSYSPSHVVTLCCHPISLRLGEPQAPPRRCNIIFNRPPISPFLASVFCPLAPSCLSVRACQRCQRCKPAANKYNRADGRLTLLSSPISLLFLFLRRRGPSHSSPHQNRQTSIRPASNPFKNPFKTI
jgi:hypothetical protein